MPSWEEQKHRQGPTLERHQPLLALSGSEGASEALARGSSLGRCTERGLLEKEVWPKDPHCPSPPEGIKLTFKSKRQSKLQTSGRSE